jgi:carbon monoxide dehydrogenase subunit G
MPEVEYTTTMRLPVAVVWEFVKDMNNWAPMLTGYRKHVVLSDTDSVWTLQGDVGVLSREVELEAHVTEWAGPDRVAFTLRGLNEPVEGGGTLSMAPAAAEAPPPPAARRGLWARVFAWLFRRLHGAPAARPLLPAGAAASRLTFRLRMDAGGITGPLVNAMLEPMLLPAAEDLANKIAAHLERTHRSAA